MISKERVRHMTKLAEYEAGEGRQYKKATQYFRRDFVALEMIKSFVTGTLAFCLMLLLWVLNDMEELVSKINEIDIMGFAVGMILWYLGFLALYLIATYAIYNSRYTKGRKRVKAFYNRLKKVDSLYKKEENMQNVDDWED